MDLPSWFSKLSDWLQCCITIFHTVEIYQFLSQIYFCIQGACLHESWPESKPCQAIFFVAVVVVRLEENLDLVGVEMDSSGLRIGLNFFQAHSTGLS